MGEIILMELTVPPQRLKKVEIALTLEESLNRYNVSAAISKVISDYFSGEGRKINPEEFNQWLNSFNQAKENFKNTNLSSLFGKKII